MATCSTWFIYEGFLFWIIPSMYRSRMIISPNILPRMKSLSWDFPHSNAATQAPPRPSKILRREISPLGDHTLLQEFSLLEARLSSSVDEISPT